MQSVRHTFTVGFSKGRSKAVLNAGGCGSTRNPTFSGFVKIHPWENQSIVIIQGSKQLFFKLPFFFFLTVIAQNSNGPKTPRTGKKKKKTRRLYLIDTSSSVAQNNLEKTEITAEEPHIEHIRNGGAASKCENKQTKKTISSVFHKFYMQKITFESLIWFPLANTQLPCKELITK